MRKENKVVGCVWGIGDRKWGDDFKGRMMMFGSMIESMYGAEIWVEETRRGKKGQEKYLRWVLKVNRETLHSEGRVQE
jgi:hypothetical protein